MAENGSPGTPDVMNATLRNARANGLAAFYLIRASDLMAGVPGRVTLAQIGAMYRALRESS